MRKIVLDTKEHKGITIMIFAEGTILKPKSWFALYNHKSYIPIGNAVEIIRTWKQQGANIIFCTSRKKKRADDMAAFLMKYGFTGTFLVTREPKDKYQDIVETIKPHILIEDDCKSIGGSWQMCITKVAPKIKEEIKSIVVPEFKGIDNLPTDVKQLLSV